MSFHLGGESTFLEEPREQKAPKPTTNGHHDLAGACCSHGDHQHAWISGSLIVFIAPGSALLRDHSKFCMPFWALAAYALFFGLHYVAFITDSYRNEILY